MSLEFHRVQRPIRRGRGRLPLARMRQTVLTDTRMTLATSLAVIISSGLAIAHELQSPPACFTDSVRLRTPAGPSEGERRLYTKKCITRDCHCQA